MKTRLYLDVDGVINYFGWYYLGKGDQEFEHPWPTHKQGTAMGYTITWSPDMLKALDELDLDIVWLTTWRNSAVEHLAPLLGWGADFRVLHPLDEDMWKFRARSSVEWKVPALINDQKENPSPFIWAEDESGLYSYAMKHQFPQSLVVTTNEFYGIDQDDIARMKDFQVSLSEPTG